jgi:Type II secretion system (T2SS), protein E, N-terminal domain
MSGDRARDNDRSGTFDRFDPARVTLAQIPVARVHAHTVPGSRKPMRGSRLGAILVAHGRIQQDQLDTVLREQVQLGGRLGELLVEQGHVAEADVVRALSEQTGIPFVSEARVGSMPVPVDAIRLLPAELAERLGALPLSLRGKQLFCALRDPRDLAVLDEIQFRAGVPSVQGVFATEGTIRRGQRRFYHHDLDQQAEIWESLGSVTEPVPPQQAPVPFVWPPPAIGAPAVEVPPALVLEDEVPPVALQLRESLLATLLGQRGALGRLPSLVRRLAQRFGAPPAEVERAAAAAEAVVLLAAPAGEGYLLPDPATLEDRLGEAAAPCRDLFAAAAGEVAGSPAAAAFAAAITFAAGGGDASLASDRSATG